MLGSYYLLLLHYVFNLKQASFFSAATLYLK
jgi:hypothetical protein